MFFLHILKLFFKKQKMSYLSKQF